MNAPLGWLGIVRLGLVQTALGSVVLLVTSTLNRIMVVELALPAVVPGILVAWHYAVQLMRPGFGHGADRGGRITPWVVGGMAVLALGGMVSALATCWMAGNLPAGLVLAAIGFTMVGGGVAASGTSLLLLLAQRVPAARRPAAATIVWLMMLAGFAATAVFIGSQLDPFTPGRLLRTAAAIALAALALTLFAIRGVEGSAPAARAAPRSGGDFRAALANVWTEPSTRAFTGFIFVAMFAYSAQELVLEPFAGSVFAETPGQSAHVAGLLHAGVFGGMLVAAIIGSLGAGRAIGAMRNWAVGGCLASGLAMLAMVAAGLAGPGWPLRPTVFLLGFANGAFVTAAISSMMELAAGDGRSGGRSGVRMGLWGAAQAIAFAAGGLVGSGASDTARLLLGAPAPAYAAVFLGEAFLFFLAAWLAAGVFRPAAAPRLPAVLIGDSGD
jgi:BCD family chlorophyll transporter-like MFS transporter